MDKAIITEHILLYFDIRDWKIGVGLEFYSGWKEANISLHFGPVHLTLYR